MEKKRDNWSRRLKGNLSAGWMKLTGIFRHEGPGKLRFYAMWSATLVVWGVVLGSVVLGYFAYGLPDIEKATTSARRPYITVLDAKGRTIAARGEIYGGAVDLKNLPKALPQAIMATEDRRFYDHFGLDLIGLARAFWVNLKAGRVVQGGSTITQQVAKNLFLTPDRTLKRKVQEVMMALWLERKFTKDQIFTLYLNRVYFGGGTYGVEAAAQRYFGTTARKLTTYQSALIAGLLKAPSRYNPQRNPDLSHQRTSVVLNNLVAAGYLEKEKAEWAKKTKSKIMPARARPNLGPYFVDWAISQAQGLLGIIDQDLTIETTLNSRLQTAAERHLGALLNRTGKKYNAGQGAVVVLNTEGAVRALVGGRDYGESQFNRAYQALRQPGSAFKPFAFLAGLDSGLKPSSMLVDEPITVGDWSPRNYHGTYLGAISLTKALAESVNTVAVKVAKRAGVAAVVERARQLGITSPLPDDLTIALGAGEVSLLELTAAYGPFANGGEAIWPYGINEIRDKRGKVLYRRMGEGPGRVVSPERVNQMNRMMRAVIENGTGKRARLDRPAAGKTGTSQESRDAWFVGYTAEFIAGAWIGNDNGAPMKNVTGGGLPALLWRDVMRSAHQGIEVKELPRYQLPGVSQPSPKPVEKEPEMPAFIREIFKIFGGD